MKRYEKYKEVDLPWLKEVPEHWDIVKNRNVFKYKKVLNKNNLEKNVLSLTLNGVINNDIDNPIGLSPKDYAAYQLFQKNDLVFKLIDLNNIRTSRIGIVHEKGIMSSAYIRFINDKTRSCSKYYYYWFYKLYIEEVFNKLGNGVRETIGKDELLNMLVPIPPLQEQIQIANFLDWKISGIDRLIELEKSKIEKLYELKISLHKDIVLNNDINIINDILLSKFTVKNIGDTLYKNVKLGHILKKVEQNADIKEDIVICSNKGISFIRGEKKIGLVSDDINVYQKVRKGQLMIHGMDTWHGAICISDFNGMCTRVVHVCETSQNKKYIYYYLRLLSFLGIYKNISNGVRQNTSDFRSWEKVKDLNILLPNLEKQNNIVLILDEKLTEIDNLISKTNNEITYLEELKQTLISDVVTGKMDIRDIEIPINYKRRFNGDREK